MRLFTVPEPAHILEEDGVHALKAALVRLRVPCRKGCGAEPTMHHGQVVDEEVAAVDGADGAQVLSGMQSAPRQGSS